MSRTAENVIALLASYAILSVAIPMPIAVGDDCDGPFIGPGCTGTAHVGTLDRLVWPEFDGTGSEFPLNLPLWCGLGPPDFPPRTLDPIAGSFALVSKESRHSGGPSPYGRRPMLNGLLDLVTGVPLYQDIDFELPFGGAVFRHVRTHSDDISHRPQAWYTGSWAPSQSQFWDWNGHNWMIGENPILLIDAAYPEVDENTRVTYLIPDAHHSIPFIRQGEAQKWIAPRWFDSSLTTSGANSSNPDDLPDYFYVWMARGALKYTFRAHYEDMPLVRRNPCGDLCVDECDPTYDDCWVSAHELWDDHEGGDGFPYYGLLEKIEDRYGNRVEITYVDQVQYDCGFEVDSEPVCCRNCNEKGQIAYVKLYPADATTAAWTLIYTHRPFSPTNAYFLQSYDNPDYAMLWHLWQQHNIHSIHVYQRDVGNPSQYGSPTLSYELFYGDYIDDAPYGTYFDPAEAPVQSFDEYDLIDAEEIRVLPDDWVIRTQYMYEEPDSGWYSGATSESQYSLAYYVGWSVGFYESWTGLDAGWINLLKATVTRRSATQESEQTETTIYRYDLWTTDSGNIDERGGGTGVRDVLRNGELKAIVDGDDGEGDSLHTINDTFCLRNTDPTPVFDHVTQEIVERSIAEMSETSVHHRRMDDDWCGTTGVDEPDTEEEVANWIGLPLDRTATDRGKRREFEDRRNNGRSKWFIHRFRVFPESAPDFSYNDLGCNLTMGVFGASYDDQSVYHFPFRFTEPLFEPYWPYSPFNRVLGQHVDFATPAWTEPFHVTVVDEWKDVDADYDGTMDEFKFVSRRAVEMNIGGFIINDRTWSFVEDPDGTLESQSGFSKKYFYDEQNRVIAVGSEGWGSAENQGQGGNPAGAGLMYVYKYHPDFEDEEEGPSSGDKPGELQAVGVRKGTAGTTYWLNSNERSLYEEQRPDLITKEIRFPTPNADLETVPGDAEITDISYGLDETTHAIESKTALGPAAPFPTSTGVVSARPITKMRCNEQGNEEFSGTGSAVALSSDLLEFYYSHKIYDSQYSRLESDEFDSRDDDPEDEFIRTWLDDAIENIPALETLYEYDEDFGVVNKITLPNGRETHMVYKLGSDPSIIDLWTYRDVVQEGSDWVPLTPVEISHIDSGRVTEKKQVEITALASYPPNGEETPTSVISVSTPSYDANGQVVGMSQQGGTSGPSISAQLGYHASGQLEWQKGPDGTITRYEYDDLGRIAKKYIGTNDEHTYWGTAPPGEPEYDDNLVLIEKRSYGTRTNDANRLTEVRDYRQKPANQYHDWDDEACAPGEEEPDCTGWWKDGVEPNEDAIGWLTVFEYDWRMRRVWEQCRDGTGAAVTHKVTWYDNLDRVCFVAEYGSTADLTDVDPRLAGPGAGVSTASAILDTEPESLTENVYNARGLVEESRRYNVTTGTFTSTFTYYDHANRPIEVRSPNSPVQRYVYDPSGRQIISRTIAGSKVITQTETVYDENGRAIKTTRRERIAADLNDDDLDSNNSIATYLHTWYDKAGRVIATANYGTNSSTFANGTAPTYDAEQIPTSSATVLVTHYEYDEAGRQSEVTRPDGAVTRNEYDALGRTLLMTENAGGSNSLRRHTAYDYDDEGRLWRMAAVFPSHNGGNGIASWGDIDWDATDSSLQVTEFIYGATVVDAENNAITLNNTWIAEARYPDKDTGQPSESNVLAFTYLSDGLVASRTDARGITLTYVYDELGRRTDVLVDDSLWYAGDPAPIEPLLRLSRIHYEHDWDGRPTTVTAYAIDNSGQSPEEVVVAENAFDYDGFGNLLYDQQEHGGLASSPKVEYDWAFSPQSAYNFNRPTGITYPAKPSSGQTELAFSYGAATGSTDSLLNRITGITIAGVDEVVTYTYGGTARRVTAALGNGVSQTVQSGDSYVGLDRFGRLTDLHFKLNSDTIQRFQYGYDRASNRTFAQATYSPSFDQQSGTWPTHDNDRSYRYVYDALDRLVTAKFGTLSSGNDVTTPTRKTDWALDILGNWSAGAGSPPASLLQTLDPNADGTPDDTRKVHHTITDDNSIEEITEDPFGANGPATTDFVHDPAGNLVYDGVYVYQYDALNRMIQVNLPGTVQFTTGARMTGTLGDMQGRYTYDGMGRMAFKELAQQPGQLFPGRVDYYYDGVRRVAERVAKPNDMSVPPPGFNCGTPGFAPCDTNCNGTINAFDIQPFLELLSPSPNPCSLCAGDANYNGTVNAFDISQFLFCLDSDGGEFVQRDYVYGQDYVDELVCQIPAGVTASAATLIYYLQDANYNVTALLRGTAQTPGQNEPPQTAVIRTQYVYEPYGQVLAIDTIGGAPLYNAAGHQGLFFEAFGAPLTSGAPLDPMAPGLYYNRNRWYSPTLGRFTSKDPNETGAPVVAAMAINGRVLDDLTDMLKPNMQYADGMNLYAPYGSNPVYRQDPAGLDWGMESDVDDATMTYIWDYMAIEGKVAEASNELGTGAKLGWLYAAAAFMWDEVVWNEGESALFGLIAGPFFAKICFVEGTAVATPAGPQPIECIPIGCEITSRKEPRQAIEEGIELPPGTDAISRIRLQYHHADGSVTTMELLRSAKLVASLALIPGSQLQVVLPEMGFAATAEIVKVEPYRDHLRRDVPVVTGRFVTDAAEVVHVYLETYEHPIGVTPRHPVFSADRQMWIASEELQPGERLESMNGFVTVARVERSPARAAVYNIEVSHYHTYFVGDAEIWAHNPCELSQQAQQLVKNFKAAGTLESRSLAAFRMGGNIKVGASHHDLIQSFPKINFESSWDHGFVSWVNGEWLFRANY